MSHTSGPWSLLCSEFRGGPRCLVVCPNDNEIASINPFRESWNEDAHLIAAAPDLLEACEDLVDKAISAGWHKELLESAQDAIKKARGEQ